jgi:hypothetical protein
MGTGTQFNLMIALQKKPQGVIPFTFPPKPTPPYPHPPKLNLVPSVHPYIVFCSNGEHVEVPPPSFLKCLYRGYI